MIERAAAAANRAIADANVIEVGVDLEPNPSAMAGTLIGLLHGWLPWLRHMDAALRARVNLPATELFVSSAVPHDAERSRERDHANMVASDGFAEFLREQLAPLGRISFRRMFGKTGVFRDGLMFGMVSEDTLYFRVDDGNRELFREAAATPPLNYEKRGQIIDLSFWRAPERLLDEPEALLASARAALAAARRVAAKRGGSAAGRGR
jgi:DNA transformation protein